MVGRDKLTPLELEMRLKIAGELNRLKNEKKLTQQDIVKESGISQSTLSQYFSGKRLPSKTNSKKLADFFKVPIEQIDPRLNTAASSLKSETAQKIDEIVSKLKPEPYQKNVLNFAKGQLVEQRALEVHDIVVEYVAYNYYDQPVSAGTGQYLNEVQIETIQLPVKVDADFVCPIYGDSMEPDYKSGDYVFVKLTVELPSGTVGVFDYEGEAYIKQLIIEKDKAYLRSFNKKYKDIPINSDSDFRIIGKVVDVYREEGGK
jgi:phage transcriptional repressor